MATGEIRSFTLDFEGNIGKDKLSELINETTDRQSISPLQAIQEPHATE